jgi:hypothetical protein
MTLTLRKSDLIGYRLLFGGVAISILGVGAWILLTGRGDNVPAALTLLIPALFFLILAGGVRGPSCLVADSQYVSKSARFYNWQIVRRVPRSSVHGMRVRRSPVLPSLDFLGKDGRVILSDSASFTHQEIKNFATYLGLTVEGLDDKKAF